MMYVLCAVLFSLLAVASIATATDYRLALEGTVTYISENQENAGQVVERRVAIPFNGESSDRSHSIQGSLHNRASTNFKDRYEYDYNGIHYMAILTNSTILIMRVESTMTVYDSVINLPSGCEAEYIQPIYSSGAGFFYVIFRSCALFYVDAISNEVESLDEYFDGRKMIPLDDTRMTYFVYIDDQGRLIVEDSEDDTQRGVIPPSDIGSCRELRDFHPFRPSSGTDVAMIMDCSSVNGDLRYVLFYDYQQRSIIRTFQVGVASGIPLGNGRYVAVLHNNRRSLSVVDTNGPPSQTPARTNFASPVEQFKFLDTTNITKLVVQMVGSNIELIDVPRFVGSLGQDGREELPNTVVHSCTPICQPVELMGSRFLMTMVYNSTSSFFDLVYQPLDPNSTTEPVRIQGPASQPLLTFVQTSLEIIPSATTTTSTEEFSTTEPSTTVESFSTTELETTDRAMATPTTEPATIPHTEPIIEPAVLPIALGITGGSVLVVMVVLVVIGCCLCRRKKSRFRTCRRKARTPGNPPSYTEAVNRPIESPASLELGFISPSPELPSDNSSVSLSDSQSTHSNEVEPRKAENEGCTEAVIPKNNMLAAAYRPSSLTELPQATQRTLIMQETHTDSGFQSRSSLENNSPPPKSKVICLNIDTTKLSGMFSRSRTAEPTDV